MTAKEYLSQYRNLDREINCLMAEMDRLRTLMYQIGGGVDGQPRGRRGQSGARYEDIVAKYVDVDNEINERIDQLLDVRKEIECTINQVEDDKQRMLLRYRYLCGMTWADVSISMHTELRWVYRLHGRALQKIVVPKIDH